MATPQLSPGVLVREVDLTVGRADNVLDNIGAIAGPFPIGPVNYPIDIATEQDLINVFGKPQSTDSQYEYWMSASSYLSYGGVLKVVRTSGTTLNNANAGVGTTSTSSLDIDNYDDYQNNHSDGNNFTFAAKNPGSWANGLKVCVIDNLADQTIGINTTNLSSLGATIGFGVTAPLNSVTIPGSGTFTGHLKGIITGITTDVTNGNSTIDVRVVSRVSSGTTQYNTTLITSASATAGVGTTIVYVNSVLGLNVLDTLTAPGLNNLTISSIGSTFVSLASTISSSITSGIAVTFSRLVTIGATETASDYAESASWASFSISNNIKFINNSGIATGSSSTAGVTPATVTDWYENQTLGLSNSTIYWKSIAPKPTSNKYVLDRNGKNDGIHVVVVDDLGTITGNQATILEKHISLSKAFDTVSAVNSPQKIWYEQFLADYSSQIYAGSNPSSAADSYWGTSPTATGFQAGIGTAGFVSLTTTQGLWGQSAQNVTFSSIGNKTYTLTGGVDYSATGGMSATLGDLQTSYNLFSNRDEIQVDYLIMGPGLTEKEKSQEKAGSLISIAEQRKDCVATIGPHRGDLINQTNTTTQTTNLVSYFSSLAPSSYAIFDSGYKYTYDRFNNKFVYVPCNADVAGLMCRTNIVAYPWFSPAGQQRGIINNAIKLAYNPNKAQRDKLYPQRVNAIVTQPGVGTLLFGDKTALGYASAFDRINVRRLFLTIEQALERAAQAQLFELNDELTRANFRNIVEPYLRDVQAKRGLYGFLVVCDSTNNTPDVIDNNEFRADIFLKPAKSINYLTLTFVATRTGVSFEEVAGTV
jgi:phage tail sheath protein FI